MPVRRAFTVVATALLCLLVVANIYLISARLVFGETLPRILGVAALAVVSGSMQPAIDVGDLVVIKEQRTYNVGDIVTYDSGRSIVTHRIVDIDDVSAIVKGDANNVADGSIPLTSIVGRVILRIPRVGDAMFLARTPIGMIVVVAVVVLLVRTVFTARRAHNEDGSEGS